jgi:hypothetical protein
MVAIAATATARMIFFTCYSFVCGQISGDRPIPDSIYFPHLAR